MQLVRYLFSYSMVVVVVVLIASGYYYRETLFPNLFSHAGHMSSSNTTAGKASMGAMTGMGRNPGMTDMTGMADKSMAAGQQMTDPIAPAPAVSATEPVAISEPAVTPEPVAPAEPAVITEPVTSVEPAVTPEPAATLQTPVSPANQAEVTSQSSEHTRMAAGPGHEPGTEMATAPVRQLPDSNGTPASGQTATHTMATGEAARPSMPMNEQATPVSPTPVVQMPRTGTGSIPLPEQQQTERRDLEAIMTARRAYWAGDYDASEQSYQQLIERYPNEIELHGELGNVYYAQGKWARAAAAYAQVVRQLYGTGQTAQADYMLEIVTSLDKELGNQLQQERDGTARSQ